MTKNLKLNDCFSTSDLSLATTISLWFPIEAIDKTNPRKAIFLFERDPDLDRLVESFWKREIKVDPLTYFNQLKIVKSRLYEEE